MNFDSSKVLTIIRDTLKVPDDFELTMNHTPVQVPGWDSLGWLNIILKLESEFHIEFDFVELEKVYSVEQLCALTAKTVNRAA